MTEITKEMQDKITKYDLLFESRLSKVESICDHINETLIRFERRFDKIDNELNSIRKENKSDFFWLLCIIGGSFVSLLGIMSKGFHWIS